MKSQLLRVGAWFLIWAVIGVGLVNYLPQHPHMKYEVALSPFVLVMALVTHPVEMMSEPLSTTILFGALFWVVVILLLFFPRKRKQGSH